MLEEVAPLTYLIEWLLLISRADAGRIELNRTRIAQMELVHESTATIETPAGEKHQRIEISRDKRSWSAPFAPS